MCHILTNTYEELENAVQDFAKVHGYAVAVARSNRDRKGSFKNSGWTGLGWGG
jgi:hypothetical protein